MSEPKPQTVPIPPSLRAKLVECVQERDEAVERLEEMLDLIRGVLADFGTPVTVEEYDLFNLQVGFVRRAAERGNGQGRYDGVIIPDPEPQEEDA